MWKCQKCGRSAISENHLKAEINQDNGKGRWCPGRLDDDSTASPPADKHKVNYENYDLIESPASSESSSPTTPVTPVTPVRPSTPDGEPPSMTPNDLVASPSLETPGGTDDESDESGESDKSDESNKSAESKDAPPPVPVTSTPPVDNTKSDDAEGSKTPPVDNTNSDDAEGSKTPPVDDTNSDDAVGSKTPPETKESSKNQQESVKENPLIQSDREGKNRGQIYYHTGVTIESAATYTPTNKWIKN